MFRSLTLNDFQSHKHSHLPLGPFTVIVGSSSSGKSAVVRAIRLVAQNARGTSYVRQGARSAQVALELNGSDSSTIVTVERGKSVSSYTVRLPEMHDEPLVYTKCASSVPDAVADVLRLGRAEVWLAGQFDRPFLLDETGAEVARVLGRLTNVDMLYAAVREANRRASEARRSHTARMSDLSGARAELGRFASLPLRLAAGERAQEALSRAEDLASRASRISAGIVELHTAAERADAARSRVCVVPDVSRLSTLSTVRSALGVHTAALSEIAARRDRAAAARVSSVNVAKLELAHNRRARLKELLTSVESSRAADISAQRLSQTATENFVQARDQFGERLRTAGTCSLCGADASHANPRQVV